MKSLITEQELKEWTGYGQRSALEKFLRESRIPFMLGKGNIIITTQAAIDAALLKREAVKLLGDDIRFED